MDTRLTMANVFLIHWNEAEARKRAARIGAMGYEMEIECADGGKKR